MWLSGWGFPRPRDRGNVSGRSLFAAAAVAVIASIDCHADHALFREVLEPRSTPSLFPPVPCSTIITGACLLSSRGNGKNRHPLDRPIRFLLAGKRPPTMDKAALLDRFGLVSDVGRDLGRSSSLRNAVFACSGGSDCAGLAAVQATETMQTSRRRSRIGGLRDGGSGMRLILPDIRERGTRNEKKRRNRRQRRRLLFLLFYSISSVPCSAFRVGSYGRRMGAVPGGTPPAGWRPEGELVLISTELGGPLSRRFGWALFFNSAKQIGISAANFLSFTSRSMAVRSFSNERALSPGLSQDETFKFHLFLRGENLRVENLGAFHHQLIPRHLLVFQGG